MKIEFLSQHPGVASTLARWHYEEWGDLIPGWTFDIALVELQSHTGQSCIPTTLVAMEGESPLGSVSLLTDDLEEWIGKYSPWLASLYVLPEARGRGIGETLVVKAVDVARASGAKTLYVFAARSEAYYLKMGWSVVERVTHHGYSSSIMSMKLSR